MYQSKCPKRIAIIGFTMAGNNYTRVIALDCATTTGWAYVHAADDGSNYWRMGHFKPLKDPERLIEILTEAYDNGCVTCAIEKPYHNVSGGWMNPKTTQKLMECFASCKMAAIHVGLKVREVYAVEWQASYGVTGPRVDRKAGAMVIAKRLGANPKSQDEADAVCLCDYATRTPEPVKQEKMKYIYKGGTKRV